MTKPHPVRQLTRGIVLVVLGAVVAMGAVAFFRLQAVDKEQEAAGAVEAKDSAEEAKDRVADAAGPICQRPQLDAETSRLCAEVQLADKQAPAPAERVDYDRVRALVNSAVAADPRISEASLLAMVQQVYEQSPPADGRTPTQEELLALVRQVYGENPPRDGVDGADGQNAFCYDNPDDPTCQPRQGEPGEPGLPGEPPYSWQTTYPDGSVQDCQRADPFDPAQPRYTCTYTPAPPPGETEQPGPGLLGGGN